MKWMIASDLHGSQLYVEKLLTAFEAEQADRLLLLGDLLYHGPRNDLPSVYNTKKVMDMLNAMKNKIFCVRGNCDGEVDQMVLEFPIMADYCLIPLGERMMFATHGHLYNTQTPPCMQKGDILLHGHTHVPAWEPFGNQNIYLNPGSVSIPKMESHHSYMTLEQETFCWKTLDGMVYHQLRL